MPIMIKIFMQINNAFAQCTCKIIDVRLDSEKATAESLNFIIHDFRQINDAFAQYTFKIIDVRLSDEEAIAGSLGYIIRASQLQTQRNYAFTLCAVKIADRQTKQ